MPAGLDGATERVSSAARADLIALVASAVQARSPHPNVLVAIDGASGTGKSTFADELAERLTADGGEIVRSTIDSFHRPRADRYQRGKDSAEGYYRDSHDLVAVKRCLLTPFHEGVGTYVTAVFDEPSDLPIQLEPEQVPDGAVLVMDGLFLHRAELVDCWDFGVFLVADGRREQAWQTYLHRDLPDDPTERSVEIEARTARARRHRYLDGQALYEREAFPRVRADLVIDNDDLAHPRIIGR